MKLLLPLFDIIFGANMSRSMLKRIAVCAVLFISVLAVNSCVNKQYEMSNDRLDLNVTLFQDGLTLPLGSTAKIRVDSLIGKLGFSDELSQFLTPDANGAYSLSFASDEPIDLSQSLNSLSGFNVKKIDVSKTIDFHFPAKSSNVKVGEVSIPTYSSTIEQVIEFAPLETVELPEYLTYVDQLVADDLYMTVTMTPDSDFPDLGDKSALS